MFDHLIPKRDRYVPVTLSELEAWIAAYPRPLIAVPPMTYKNPSVRWWRDPTIGEADQGNVAVHNSIRGGYCQVLRVIP